MTCTDLLQVCFMSKHCDEEIEDRCDGLTFLLSRQTGEESSFNGVALVVGLQVQIVNLKFSVLAEIWIDSGKECSILELTELYYLRK